MTSPVVSNQNSVSLEKCTFDDLRHWASDDHLEAFQTFANSAARMVEKPYRPVSTYFEPVDLLNCAKQALRLSPQTEDQAKAFFEENFEPHRILPRGAKFGFVTGFYEPEVVASSVPTGEFKYPLYARPPELADINDENRPDTMDPSFRYGRKTVDGFEPYFNRRDIQSGALNGQGLELVWMKDKVDVFFIHVQGSARLAMVDGTTRRVTYAAKSGHAYSSVAKILCQREKIAVETMTADKLADWMRSHPDQIDDLLAQNDSYIFFKEVELRTEESGPIAAAKVPLTAGRSIAVDRTLHTFGLPFWVETNTPLPEDKDSFARLMIAQDTGSAIVGPARADLFMGSGDAAGLIAGRIRHDANLTVLVPRS